MVFFGVLLFVYVWCCCDCYFFVGLLIWCCVIVFFVWLMCFISVGLCDSVMLIVRMLLIVRCDICDVIGENMLVFLVMFDVRLIVVSFVSGEWFCVIVMIFVLYVSVECVVLMMLCVWLVFEIVMMMLCGLSSVDDIENVCGFEYVMFGMLSWKNLCWMFCVVMFELLVL